MSTEFSFNDAKAVFPKRDTNSNKGDFGRTVILGGSLEFSGALKLANIACAALRSGCGLCAVAVPRSIANGVILYLLESMLIPLPDKGGRLCFEESVFATVIKNAKSVAFGMGLGRSSENMKILEFLLDTFEGRLLIDADGLNTLAENPNVLKNKKCKVTLTPHLVEFGRLTRLSVEEILAEPEKRAECFANEFGVTLLLKGNKTTVSDGVKTVSVICGTPAMAKGGSGDVLSGVIAGINAFSKADGVTNAATGALIAGRAGELAAELTGEYCMLASDEVKMIPKAVSEIINF